MRTGVCQRQSTDGLSTIKSVAVENCKNSELCEWTKGRNHELKVTYTAPKNVETVKVLISGLVGGAELPFPGLKRYICKTPGNENFCPQTAGQEYTATITLPILSVFPKIETTAFVRFIDDDAKSEAEEKLGCFHMQIKLIDDPEAPKVERVDNQEDDE
ncbi:epididymal secretory protein E1-like [Tropilaelaps mercedesae]|uniref:Epididymal secretory protein E1-like n=1 Tax=Tropilaelaps mercedesae TaxID=418985 RepID=A0A1V9XYL7_9ACAR|nr:epididymal secretory protein E1-like [Tropilaelaps mercedesae]